VKLLFWTLIVLLAAVLALFAASNRGPVTLALWPLSFAIEAPLYLAVLGSVLLGLMFGALAAWVAGRRRRREARQRGRRIAALEHELTATQAQLPDAAETPPARAAARG
jgi:uncharacterized integral membrane protein